uniref:SGNH hydrolase-type esterase domain-containing protein n=1 Tax=viral metagenome TaxID=1070528 RepID=A0A6C0IWF8_9ZZZZ
MKGIFLLLVFIVFIIVVFIIVVSIIVFIKNRSFKEGLTNKQPNNKNKNNNNNSCVILIGDSILNNSNYIGHGQKTTFDNLKDILGPTVSLYNYAEDGATIQYCFQQVDKIPIDSLSYSNDKLCIVVSCGGNDILNSRMKSNINNNIIDVSLDKLSLLIKSIQTKFPSSHIYLLNLYYPFHSKYSLYQPSIQSWNEKIQKLTRMSRDSTLVNITDAISEPKDLIYDIEPSESGGYKVAVCISNSL